MIRRKKCKLTCEEWYKLRKYKGLESDNDASNTVGSFIADDGVLGKTIIRSIMFRDKTLFLGLISFRCINALFIQTFYVPDEYWQSTEVAHTVAFGYGYLTWEWKKGIRSFVYPSVFAILYKVLEFLKLDYKSTLIILPRMLQALSAASCDFYFFKLVRKLHNPEIAHWALMCQVTSWFNFYISTRTLSNCIETTLTTVAMYHYPWQLHKNHRDYWKYILVAATSVAVRPTSAIIWVLLCSWHLQRLYPKCFRLLTLFGALGSLVILLSAVIDRWFYGEWILSHWNFLQFNVISGIGSMYGTQSWHWYFSQGFPVILATHIYPFIRGIFLTKDKVLLVVILWTLSFYSFLGHKEFRFIYPVLPLAMVYCGVYFQSLMPSTKINSVKAEKPKECTEIKPQNVSRRKSKVIIGIMVLINVILASYFCLIHQRGVISLMHYLSNEASSNPRARILYLMPCHSTPFYSYMHTNVSMRFLTCEPNFLYRDDYLDEADAFYADPKTWIQAYLKHERGSPPTHIAYFCQLSPYISGVLGDFGYQVCSTFFHSHITQGRRSERVLVSCLLTKPP